MKGIILAGGTGSRLYPLTLAVNKQLLPVYDKPLIYYPLSLLIECGLTEILLISSPPALPAFYKLLGDGLHVGINLSYAPQESPGGIAQALLIAEDFLAGDSCCLVLGDNIFIAPSIVPAVRKAAVDLKGALIFACQVQFPARYGVLAWDECGQVQAIVEKPSVPPSSWAVTGLYCFDGSAPKRAAKLKPSARGELEITDVNVNYLQDNALQVDRLPRSSAWFDAGTPGSLLDAANYVQVLQTRQGRLIGSPEICAYRRHLIVADELRALGHAQQASPYGQQLLSFAMEDRIHAGT